MISIAILFNKTAQKCRKYSWRLFRCACPADWGGPENVF